MDLQSADQKNQTASRTNDSALNQASAQLSTADAIGGLPAIRSASGLQPAQLLQLQKAMGNQAVRQLLKSGDQQGGGEEKAGKPAAANRTGLPDRLKQGVESLSGMSMDDVKVHYNSAKPADLQALAYAEGTNIHIGPGQEKHLPHEAWHVVQQKQGRVKPTLQAKGIPVNDDIGLESEATMMGGRALQTESAKEPAGKPGLSTDQLQSVNPVKQLKVDPVTTEDEYEAMMESRFAQGINVDWMPTVTAAYNHLDKLRHVLEDDDDVRLFGEMEVEFDQWVKAIDDATSEFQPLIDANPDEVTNKKRRTQGAPVGELQAKVNEIFDLNKKVINGFAVIKGTFPLHEGGFSAKGRAHAIRTSDTATGTYVEDATWFEGIKLNDVQMDNKPYKESKKTPEVASAPLINREIDQKYADDATKLQKLEEKLDALVTSSGEISLKGAPAGRARGDGQVAAMKGTNATGYAKLAGVPGYQNTKWEWLHIRGASLGGATDGSNLVLGSRDVNTHMMPFESNIRTLGKIVSDHKDRFEELKVTYSAAGQDAAARHKVQSITIKWELVKKHNAPVTVEATKGEALFKPLTGNASISKDEVDILEQSLKAERKKVTD